MDIWLTEEEMQALCNIESKPLEIDVNWQQLKQSRKPKFDFHKTVKTQSPTLMLFEKHNGFVYRRWDGAHWHTELRQLDRALGLTSTQRRLKDSIDTLLVLKHAGFKLTWQTPLIKDSGDFDPRYQLLTDGEIWYCCINDKIYSQSNQRVRQDKGYTEITFSTRCDPIFTQHSVEQLLDK